MVFPTGSVLGTILFIIYTNDCSDCFTGSSITLIFYADDAKLYSCIQCVDDMHYLQLGLDFIYNWSVAWQLLVNAPCFSLVDSLTQISIKLIILIYHCVAKREILVS